MNKCKLISGKVQRLGATGRPEESAKIMDDANAIYKTVGRLEFGEFQLTRIKTVRERNNLTGGPEYQKHLENMVRLVETPEIQALIESEMHIERRLDARNIKGYYAHNNRRRPA